MRQVYRPSSSHFVFYEILCSFFGGWTSPRCCSRGSPGGWIKKFTKLVDIYHSLKKLRWLLYKWGRYLTFWTLEKKKKKRKTKYRSFKKKLFWKLKKQTDSEIEVTKFRELTFRKKNEWKLQNLDICFFGAWGGYKRKRP